MKARTGKQIQPWQRTDGRYILETSALRLKRLMEGFQGVTVAFVVVVVKGTHKTAEERANVSAKRTIAQDLQRRIRKVRYISQPAYFIMLVLLLPLSLSDPWF